MLVNHVAIRPLHSSSGRSFPVHVALRLSVLTDVAPIRSKIRLLHEALCKVLSTVSLEQDSSNVSRIRRDVFRGAETGIHPGCDIRYQGQ